jgi:hypothetical protein
MVTETNKYQDGIKGGNIMSENIKSIMEQLGEGEFLLPVGYVDGEGVLHRTVTLRPMTGETEEAIADPKVRDNAGKMLTELFFSVVDKLGAVKKVNKEVLRDMTTIDRDYLMVRNAQVSVGEEIQYKDKCHCGAINEVSVNLVDIPVDYLSEDDEREFTFDLPNGYRDRDGKVHKKITVVLPTGRVQERISPLVRTNPASATTMMLQLITKKLGDLEFINPDVFKSMTKKDRDYISKKLGEIKAGVKLSFEVTCSECGETFTTTIPIQSLLGE